MFSSSEPHGSMTQLQQPRCNVVYSLTPAAGWYY